MMYEDEKIEILKDFKEFSRLFFKRNGLSSFEDVCKNYAAFSMINQAIIDDDEVLEFLSDNWDL